MSQSTACYEAVELLFLPSATSHEILQHAECASSPNSVYHLCQTEFEADNVIDGEACKLCKEHTKKKHGAGATAVLEAADFLGASNAKPSIENERHDILHDNSDEVNATIANERHIMLQEFW